ncbi:MAG: N-acetylmuramoyl-L-alanine amidase [Verrucomicrobiota bacterium]
MKKLVRCLAIALAGIAQNAIASSDWQVIKVGNRDFLSIDNIAKFYGLSSSFTDPVVKKVRLDNGWNDLEAKLGSREIMINGVRNWLSFPVTEKDGRLLISRVDLAKTLEPQLRPQMISNLGKVQTVVLDPGHGGYDKGAISGHGCEKDFALDVARQLRPLLQAQGFKVIMTRESDVFVPLELRARIANAAKDSIFVSIHFNATDRDPAATGFEIYSLTPIGSPSSQDENLAPSFMNRQAGSSVDGSSIELSTSIYHSMLGQIPEFDRGIKRARFAVLRLTKVPAVLIEGGFLTERGESRLIANKDWRRKLALTISVGIGNYRDLTDKKKRPMVLADYRRLMSGELTARDAAALSANPSPAPALIPVSN